MTAPKKTFAELLAERRAAAAANPAPAPELPAEVVNAKAELIEAKASKEMTFAEKLAAAKRSAPAAPVSTPAEVVEPPKSEPALLPTKPLTLPSAVTLAEINQTLHEAAVKEVSNSSEPLVESLAPDFIRDKIGVLEQLGGLDLITAMSDLKEYLLGNPAAASLMLPEDIGQMTRALRKMTGNQKAAALAAPAKKRATKAVATASAKDIAAALDDVDLDSILNF